MSNESLVSLFKKRVKLGTTVKVPFPSAEEPILILEVKRMAPAELRASDAAGLAKAGEYELGSRGWMSAYSCGVSLELARRLPVIGWESKSEDVPAFDRAVCQTFMDSLDLNGCLILTNGYRDALLADEAAALGNETTPAQDSERA